MTTRQDQIQKKTQELCELLDTEFQEAKLAALTDKVKSPTQIVAVVSVGILTTEDNKLTVEATTLIGGEHNALSSFIEKSWTDEVKEAMYDFVCQAAKVSPLEQMLDSLAKSLNNYHKRKAFGN